jgi:hypothetical protein
LGNNGEPIYIHGPNDSEEDEGKDKAVDSIVIAVYKNYYHDEIVEAR